MDAQQALRDFARTFETGSPIDDLDNVRAFVHAAKSLEDAVWTSLDSGRVTLQQVGDHFGVSRQNIHSRIARARRPEPFSPLGGPPRVRRAREPDAPEL